MELDEKHSELKAKIFNKAIERYDNFIAKYNDKKGEDYKNILKYLIDTIQILLYNEKSMPILIKKSIDKKHKTHFIKKHLL